MFDYVNDFLCLISSKPQVLAQLGGNYDVSKPSKQKYEPSGLQPPTISETLE